MIRKLETWKMAYSREHLSKRYPKIGVALFAVRQKTNSLKRRKVNLSGEY
jgi:hypothetical protein